MSPHANVRAHPPGPRPLTPKGLHDRGPASYSILMEWRNPTEHRDPLLAAKGLLEFKPWMLALAVFLACALGVGVMEHFRDASSVWAQVTAQDAPAR
jgi:hypothetical protein